MSKNHQSLAYADVGPEDVLSVQPGFYFSKPVVKALRYKPTCLSQPQTPNCMLLQGAVPCRGLVGCVLLERLLLQPSTWVGWGRQAPVSQEAVCFTL
jgi:hypothetical protein